MPSLRVISSLALTCLAVVSASSVRAEPRAVIELFTSQGCSSCPAADQLLAELARDPSLLPMTLAVDYWDYLGWKDSLALKGPGNRQRAYSGPRRPRQGQTPPAPRGSYGPGPFVFRVRFNPPTLSGRLHRRPVFFVI